MRKYLELFTENFPADIANKLVSSNWPYVGYSMTEDRVIHAAIPEPEEPDPAAGYVDLGLSVMWAECNLGASSPEEFGNYYGWGDVEGYSEGEPLSTGNYFNNDISYSKTYDAVTVSKQDDIYMDLVHYRMPTAEQWQELADNTTREVVILNDCRVLKFTSKINNAVIYMPVYESKICRYRTSTPASNKYCGTVAEVWASGQTIDVYNGSISAQYCYIRGVCSPVPKVQIIPHTTALSSDSTYGIFYNLENIEITSSSPFIIHIGKTEDFTFAADDPNRLDKYESSKVTSGYSIKLTKTDLNLGGGIHDYMYVKFECDSNSKLQALKWSPITKSADKSILIRPGVPYSIAAKFANDKKYFRLKYDDWKDYNMTLKWAGTSANPTYFADACDFTLSSTNSHVLTYKSIQAKGSLTLTPENMQAWASGVDEDGFIYVRFNPNNQGRVTFTTSKPAEVDPTSSEAYSIAPVATSTTSSIDCGCETE